MLLAKAIDRGGTERVGMKSAIVERELANYVEERRLLDKELKRFPLFFKLWLKLGQLEERLGRLTRQGQGKDKARTCLGYRDFWALCYKLELQHGNFENQKEVQKKCIVADPNHEEKWQAISKAVENSH
ncbi:hypothetical protein KPL71_022025 [Citrus sinensis]|uniref:Uncharacterized protein n=1 Tax=Citrus sinensis TaxID=2711 RepID=A0ACB8JKY5_CITSI|nr:hypothetical protein KPL71_022025 [Citrus sinensis]